MTITRKLRVLIVDDSLFVRAALKKLLESDGRFEVIGQAKDGAEAVAEVQRLGPDVISMDVNMPKLSGIEAVREIMRVRPTPVVMLSSHTKQGAKETLEALAAGAIDFVTKPSGEVSADLARVGEQLKTKMVTAAASRPRTLAPPTPMRARTLPIGIPGAVPRVLVIAISTGGPATLSQLVPRLPVELSLAVIIVQHMPEGFTSALAERLDAASRLEVKEAQTGDRPRAGLVLIAPGDRHLELSDEGAVVLTDGPLVNGCRPAADVTMKSIARVCGRRAVGLVMTGMGRDGASGLAAIKAAGGKTFAQDRESSVIWGMPKAAIEDGVVDEVVELDDLPSRLTRA